MMMMMMMQVVDYIFSEDRQMYAQDEEGTALLSPQTQILKRPFLLVK
jgi:hypothetical protein